MTSRLINESNLMKFSIAYDDFTKLKLKSSAFHLTMDTLVDHFRSNCYESLFFLVSIRNSNISFDF